METFHREGRREIAQPLYRVVVAAVIRNPWAEGPFVDDLSSEVARIVPPVARELLLRLGNAVRRGTRILAYGKSAFVGLDGEIEHGSALIHTPHLGNRYRAAVGGEAPIAFTEGRGAAGSVIDIPMWHVNHFTTRAYYQTTSIRVPDAPRADEIVLAVAGATGPRPFARIGDSTTDEPVHVNDVQKIPT